jgi:methionyl-tRNA formyltransferase
MFSRRALEHLIGMGAEVVGVCTLNASAVNADHQDLSSICEAHGIPWRYTVDINAPDSLDWIRVAKPDVVFCFGWSKLLKRDLLQLAPKGVVGYHPSALPANRGRHPLIWALVLGLARTGSTFFFMDEGADTGDILSQRDIAIEPADDASSLYEKMTQVALAQIDEFLPLLSAGTNQRIAQDRRQGNTWRKRGAPDGLIDWRMSAKTIHNLVRGLARPYIGAEFRFENATVKVWRAEVVDIGLDNLEPGKVLAVNDAGPIIKCGEGAIRLLETDPPIVPNIGAYI